jgi:hypothetical protein
MLALKIPTDLSNTRIIRPLATSPATSFMPNQFETSFQSVPNVPSDVSSSGSRLSLHQIEEDASLGLASSHFAELYGITSDMEPILMVCLMEFKELNY